MNRMEIYNGESVTHSIVSTNFETSPSCDNPEDFGNVGDGLRGDGHLTVAIVNTQFNDEKIGGTREVLH